MNTSCVQKYSECHNRLMSIINYETCETVGFVFTFNAHNHSKCNWIYCINQIFTELWMWIRALQQGFYSRRVCIVDVKRDSIRRIFNAIHLLINRHLNVHIILWDKKLGTEGFYPLISSLPNLPQFVVVSIITWQFPIANNCTCGMSIKSM